MKLAHPFIQLPLLFDAPRLAAEVAALGESVWMPHPQGFPGNSMLPLVAVNGEPANESFSGAMQATPLLARCPTLTQTIAALGVTAGRSRLMRLSGHAEVTRHADQGYYWLDRVRVHVPLVTQPTVRFECGDAQVNMAAGECWIFDTWRQHRVLNDAEESRIHLVVDTVGGERFWSMVAAGRSHDHKPLSERWSPRQVLPQQDATPDLVLESVNVPKVMSPWELSARIGFLLAEAQPHPGLAQVQQAAGRLRNQWYPLWAAHGERESGWPAYRAAIDEFMQEMRRVGGQIILKNEMLFAGSMLAQVGKIAVVLQSAAADAIRAPDEARVVAPAATTLTKPVAPNAATPTDAQFDRPIFVVSSPRSGSTMLFEALAQARGVFTIGGESHTLIEGMPELSPVTNGLGSNRLTSMSATAAVANTLRERFRAALVDRDGQRPPPGRVRMLEKTPKNSLRVPFLAQVFSEAQFVYLYRDACETMGSMIDAWNSGRFRTYPGLPGWLEPAWSLLLIPGWPSLIGKSLGEVVATQWETATRLLLDDLEGLPAGRVQTVRYDELHAAPEPSLQRLSAALGLERDRPLDGSLPLSRYTLSAPAPDKWRRHAAAIEPQLPRLRVTMERADAFTRR